MTDSDDLHRLDKAIALTPVTEGDPSVLRGETTPEYWNMVGPFGGSTAATLLRAVLMQPDVHGEPVSLTVNYAGPLGEGEFEIA
ncbi:MAG TPA: thioesterase family protein, partial [Dietzia timorensis]|nr:thioesterase family protein [Dietzia timorensis]